MTNELALWLSIGAGALAILFGIVSETPIDRLFLGGLVPGVLLVGLMSGWAVREGWIRGVPRARFEWREARQASNDSMPSRSRSPLYRPISSHRRSV